jgi:hypothetical protein
MGIDLILLLPSVALASLALLAEAHFNNDE